MYIYASMLYYDEEGDNSFWLKMSWYLYFVRLW